jgi:hypothetical protein
MEAGQKGAAAIIQNPIQAMIHEYFTESFNPILSDRNAQGIYRNRESRLVALVENMVAMGEAFSIVKNRMIMALESSITSEIHPE